MWPQLILKVNYFPELRRGAGHDLPAWSQLLIIPRLETDPCNPSINHSSEQSAYLKFHTGKEEGDITLKNEGGTIFLDLVKTHEIRSFYPQNSVIGGRGILEKRFHIFPLPLVTSPDNITLHCIVVLRFLFSERPSQYCIKVAKI